MDRDSDEARETRAAARRERATVRRTRLSEADTDLDPIVGAPALSLVTALTRQSWSLGRKELPRYERSNIPCRFVPGRLR